MIRRQLPVYSPLSLGAMASAAARGWTPGSADPRHALAELLADRYHAEHVLLLGSGTQALSAAIGNAGDDDAPVALPGFTCFDVATAAVGANRPILLYDIDPDTLGPDWPSLEAALDRGARTVVIAYLYGVPVDWTRVEQLAGRYEAAIVEDAAQGIGASWRGQPLGTLAPISVLSFGRGKGWTAGRGGALLTRGREPGRLREPAQPRVTDEISTAVAVLAQWGLARPSIYGVPYSLPWLELGETHYREPEPPRSMGRFAAALAVAGFRVALDEAGRRGEVAARLRTGPDDSRELVVPAPPEDSVAGYLRLPVRIPDPQRRSQVLADFATLGVAPSYPASLRHLPAVRSRLTARLPTPGADRLADEMVTFPTHSRLSIGDARRLRDAFTTPPPG